MASVGLGQGRSAEQSAAAQFPAEVGGQAAACGIGAGGAAPGVAQMAGEGQKPHGQAEAHQQLQAEMEHGWPCTGDAQARQGKARHAGTCCPRPLSTDPLVDPAAEPGPEPLPELAVEELETLLAALDPLLDGFGDGGSCLDDACAFLARLGIQPPPEAGPEQAAEPPAPLLQWLERWRAAGGNRETLRLVVRTLLAQRR